MAEQCGQDISITNITTEISKASSNIDDLFPFKWYSDTNHLLLLASWEISRSYNPSL